MQRRNFLVACLTGLFGFFGFRKVAEAVPAKPDGGAAVCCLAAKLPDACYAYRDGGIQVTTAKYRYLLTCKGLPICGDLWDAEKIILGLERDGGKQLRIAPHGAMTCGNLVLAWAGRVKFDSYFITATAI